ncbi:MAG: HAD family phosphatase [Oscillospiraceae bacterium]|nr:HAD family phosphatase [Oscillospiraceae bacterium]
MEKEKDIRLIALDLDGTLTNSEKIITAHTKDILRRAMEQGVYVALASGRPTPGVLPLAHELELEKQGGFALSYNGGRITDMRSGELLHESHVPQELIPELCQFAADNGVNIISYSPMNEVVTENPDDQWVELETRISGIPCRKVPDLAAELTYPVPKLLITVDPSRMEEVEQKLAKQFEGRLEVFHSSPFFLEMMEYGYNKGAALNVLLNKLELTKDHLMACGDSGNDIAMIRLAGIGVAMGNAEDAVKAQADYVTASNDEDGVAKAIEKFVL